MPNPKINDPQNKHGGSSHPHDHTHGATDPILLTTKRGIWAIKWSFVCLFITALFQCVIVYFSGSIALLGDTIHNFADAGTAIPLWLAFLLARQRPTKRFTYGYGRLEDLAGVVIVFAIFSTALLVAYESLIRLINPQSVEYLWAVVLAAMVGFLGNEGVARLRIKVGKEIGSAALVADGNHARADGFTSLAVLLGAVGIWFGYLIADPLVGLAISLVILKIGWSAGKSVFNRLLDGVDPTVVDEIKDITCQTEEVVEVTDVRVRWLGHRLHAELNIAVRSDLNVAQGHEITLNLRHKLLHQLPYLSKIIIHVDPENASGEAHHRITNHAHDDLSFHSHP